MSHAIKMFLREICSKEFAKKDILRRHTRCAHDQKQYQCGICLKNFTRKDDVLSHKKSVYTFCKPFTCEKCNKQFSKQFNYNRPNVSCSKCQKCLLQLNEHVRQRISDHAVPTECPGIDQRSAKKSRRAGPAESLDAFSAESSPTNHGVNAPVHSPPEKILKSGQKHH